MTDSTDERWLPVPGWDDLYEVSNLGRVRSLARWVPSAYGSRQWRLGRILQPTIVDGYQQIHLQGWGCRKKATVHRLVLLAFVGPCASEMQACHNNGNRTDNRLENLRWDTNSANQRDAVRHGTNSRVRRTHCPQGHPYDEENTRVYIRDGRPRRECRACRVESLRRSNAKRKAA